MTAKKEREIEINEQYCIRRWLWFGPEAQGGKCKPIAAESQPYISMAHTDII